jgi:hypothetical protein
LAGLLDNHGLRSHAQKTRHVMPHGRQIELPFRLKEQVDSVAAYDGSRSAGKLSANFIFDVP